MVLALVPTSVEDLVKKLDRAVVRLTDQECHRIKEVSGTYFFESQLSKDGRLAFLFPGEGAQYLNMLSDLCRHFPVVRAAFDEMDRRFAGDARGYVLSEILFPPPTFTEEERVAAEKRLWRMDAAVEAVHTANHAMQQLLTGFGVRPDVLLGHSTGEYSAMRAAGMLDEVGYEGRVLELDAIHRGAEASGRVPMAARLIAVGAPRDRVTAALASLGDAVAVAMDNCRHQVVVVAPQTMSSKAEALLKSAGFLYEVLAFDRPYHTPFFEEFAQGMRGFTEGLVARPPVVPLYSATSVGLFPDDLAGVHQIAYEHWLRPVEFRRTIERMHDDGVRIFVEAGPRGNLTAFVDDILAGRSYAAIAANVTRRSGIAQLNHLLAQLASHGVPLQLDLLYASRRPVLVDWTNPVDSRTMGRPLGRVKIPTCAPEMHLSPDVIEMLRSRTGAVRPPDAAAAARPAAAGAGPARSGARVHDGVSVRPTPASAISTPVPAAAASAALPAPMPDSSGLPEGMLPMAGDVMSAFLGNMERFLGIEHELMAAAVGAPLDGSLHAAVPDAPESLAFIDTLVSHRAGEDLVAECTLDLRLFPCLRDHTLGRDISLDDPDLPAFPVVPFTMLAEMMAQAATVLVPDAVLAEMRSVRVNRWLALDQGPVTMEMRAQRKSATEVSVQIVQQGGPTAAPVADGIMVFAQAYPAPPAPMPLQLQDPQAFKWSPGELYEEAMFHGPMFRGVAAVDAVGRNGALATIEVLERQALMAPWASSGLVTDFVLLDQPGQVVGFWASQYLSERFMVLPFQMASLTFYGPMLAEGTRLECLARVEPVGDSRVRADLDLVRADGTLHARFEGWEDRRFDLPAQTLRLLLSPQSTLLSEPWPSQVEPSRLEPFVARRLGPDAFPADWLTAHGGLWRRVLATVMLGRREREAWHALQLPDARAIEWLLGRIAAKDAVRLYLRQTAGLEVQPADIELAPDAHGRPLITGGWVAAVGRAPLVSISHVDGVAVAIAGDAAGLSGLGVDLERLGRMQPSTARIAFTPGELALLDGVDAAVREAWSLRMWCAKEACAKATGRGLASGLHSFAVHRLDREGGAISIRFQSPDRAPADLLALTAQHGDWIFATCFTGEDTRT